MLRRDASDCVVRVVYVRTVHPESGHNQRKKIVNVNANATNIKTNSRLWPISVFQVSEPTPQLSNATSTSDYTITLLFSRHIGRNAFEVHQ